MEKLNMQTTNVVDENIRRIGEMFPNCLTERLNAEGKPEVAIDFDQLRQELSKDIVEGPEERYQFTWPDKRNAIRLANAPTTDTLRPCREESVDFDNTQNLYIEGDNLEVLKLLRENYLGKVKMIYIDPPYNTGNDFVYNDDFDIDRDMYIHNSGQYDEDGYQTVPNTESNGRFHTDWLNMIYPRLKVAKDLLSEDGVILISIDDNEIENLKKISDEVLGPNHCEIYIWDVREPGTMPKTAKNTVRKEHEYLVACFKSSDMRLSKYKSQKYLGNNWPNPDNDPRGGWMSANISRGSEGSTGGSKSFVITNPQGISFDRDWAVTKEEYEELLKDNRIYFADNGFGVPRKKIFTTDIIESIQSSLFEDLKSSQSASSEIKKLLGAKCFDFPKPVHLIFRLLQIASRNDSIILDFFSGSATTAHAVMQFNAENGGKRKFIMVQLPEATDEKSEAYKAGYKNICEIGKERIRRAGKKIKEESPLTTQDLDTGFRVLKLDSSNMQDVYYTPADFNERDLFEDNIKPDRTDEDLLFQTMIELGIELSAKIEKREIGGKTVWNVSDGYLLACFDENVNETTITEIAKQHPYYFVMRDKSLANDNVADNFEQIFEHYSKDTIRRIL